MQDIFAEDVGSGVPFVLVHGNQCSEYELWPSCSHELLYLITQDTNPWLKSMKPYLREYSWNIGSLVGLHSDGSGIFLKTTGQS